MSLNNANQISSGSVYLGSLAATAIIPAIYFPKRTAVKSVTLTNGAALAVDGTNNALVKLQDNNGGGTPIDLASYDTSQANVTAGDGKGALAADIAVPLVALVAPMAGSQGGNPPSVGYPLDIAAGKSLQVSYTKGGTGSLTNANLQIDYFTL